MAGEKPNLTLMNHPQCSPPAVHILPSPDLECQVQIELHNLFREFLVMYPMES